MTSAESRHLPWEGYIRVSAVGRRDRIISPGTQRKAIKRKAVDMGVTVDRFTDEINTSGRKLDQRDNFLALMARIERGEIGGIIVAKTDRFARNAREALNLLHPIDYRIAVANLPIDTSTWQGRQQLRDRLSQDEAIGDQLAEEFEIAKEQAISNGTPINSRPAVGLRKVQVPNPDPDEDDPIWNLAVDRDVAPIIHELYVRRAAGEGPAALGAFLESHGVTTSMESATWSKQAIYGLIKNPIYKGMLRYGKDDRFVNVRAVEPTVDAALWEAAQHPSGKARPLRSGTNLLAGLLRHAECSYCMQGTVTSRGKRIYRCNTTHAGGRCPEPLRVDAERVEVAAVEAFWAITADMEARGVADQHDTLAELTAAARAAQDAYEQAKSPAVQEAMGNGPEWPALLTARRIDRDEKVAAAARARAAVPAAPVATATLREAWEHMTTAERREVMTLRFDCIALRRRDDRCLELVIFPAGAGPAGLTRRGFKRAPVLKAIDVPADARVVAL